LKETEIRGTANYLRYTNGGTCGEIDYYIVPISSLTRLSGHENSTLPINPLDKMRVIPCRAGVRVQVFEGDRGVSVKGSPTPPFFPFSSLSLRETFAGMPEEVTWQSGRGKVEKLSGFALSDYLFALNDR
jgi:hypothetical protein